MAKNNFAFTLVVAFIAIFVTSCGDNDGVLNQTAAVIREYEKTTTPPPTPKDSIPDDTPVIEEPRDSVPDTTPDIEEPTDSTSTTPVAKPWTITGGMFYKKTNDNWPSERVLTRDTADIRREANLRPTALFDRKGQTKFTLTSTQTEDIRFVRVNKADFEDLGWDNTLSNDSVKIGKKAATIYVVLTNDIKVPVNVERRYGKLILGDNQEVPLLNGWTDNEIKYDGSAKVEKQDTIFEESLLKYTVRLGISMQVTPDYRTDEDVMRITICRKIELPAEEEPEPEVNEPEEEPEPEPEVNEPEEVDVPQEDPVKDEPVVVPAPAIDIEIEGLKSFVAWTIGVGANAKLANVIMFDCGDNWKCIVLPVGISGKEFNKYITPESLITLPKNMVQGRGHNSVQYFQGSVVPAVAYSLYEKPDNWCYSTELTSPINGEKFWDKEYTPEDATVEENDNFVNGHTAKTTWSVEAYAEPSMYNGKKVLTITAHKYCEDGDYKIVIIEK